MCFMLSSNSFHCLPTNKFWIPYKDVQVPDYPSDFISCASQPAHFIPILGFPYCMPYISHVKWLCDFLFLYTLRSTYFYTHVLLLCCFEEITDTNNLEGGL